MVDPKDIIREHVSIIDIVTASGVTLKQQGGEYKGLCPFHPDKKTPSLSVDDEQGIFHCYGCSEAGDMFMYYMKFNDCDFQQAIKQISEDFGIELPEKKENKALTDAYKAVDSAEAMYITCLMDSPDTEVARQELQKRGIHHQTAKDYRLGFAPDFWSFLPDTVANKTAGLLAENSKGGFYDRFRNRIMFPVYNNSGHPCGFSGRLISGDGAKYLNSPDNQIFDKSSLLYGFYQHKGQIRQKKQALIVEGNFDLLQMAQCGFLNTVATLGTALTAKHVKQLSKVADEVVLIFDGDSAGLKAALKSVALFLDFSLACRVAVLPDGQDPDSFLLAYGPDALQDIIDNSSQLHEFLISELIKKHGDDLPAKKRVAEELSALIEKADNRITAELMASHWAKELDIHKSCFIEVTEQDQEKVSIGSDSSLILPDSLIYPGGLISLGMHGLEDAGLNIWQYNLPIVLAVIARAITGKVSVSRLSPVFYHLKVGASQTGKSQSNRVMKEALEYTGLKGHMRETDFASGQAIKKSLSRIHNRFCVVDEMIDFFERQNGYRTPKAEEIIKTLMSVFTLAGCALEKEYSSDEGTFEIPYQYLSLVGNVTDEIINHLTEKDLKSGMAPRWTFWRFAGKSEWSEKFGSFNNERIIAFAKGIKSLIEIRPHQDGVITKGQIYDVSTGLVSGSLKKYRREVFDKTQAENDCLKRPCIPMTYTDALKYTLIHMASTRTGEDIYKPAREEDLDYGIRLAGGLSEFKINYLTGNIVTGEFHAACEVFKDAIRAAQQRPTLKHLESRRKVLLNWKDKEREDVIKALVDREEIRIDESGRKPAYFLI